MSQEKTYLFTCHKEEEAAAKKKQEARTARFCTKLTHSANAQR